jgi:hypothetical protein
MSTTGTAKKSTTGTEKNPFFGKQSISGIKLQPLKPSTQTSKKMKTPPKKGTQKLSPIQEPPIVQIEESVPHMPNIPKLEIPISKEEISEINKLRELRDQETARKVLMAEMERQEMENALYDKTKKQRLEKEVRSKIETNRERSARKQEKKHQHEMDEKRKGITGLLTEPLTLRSKQFIEDLDRFSKPDVKVISPNFGIRAKREGLIDKIQQINEEISALNKERKNKHGLPQSEQIRLFKEYETKQKMLLNIQKQQKSLEKKMAKSPTSKKPENVNPRTKKLSVKAGKTRKCKKCNL